MKEQGDQTNNTRPREERERKKFAIFRADGRIRMGIVEKRDPAMILEKTKKKQLLASSAKKHEA